MIILGIIFVVVGLIIGVVFYLTSGATKSADNFFSLVKEGKTDEAYQSLSQQFKEKTTEEQFEVFIETSSLVDFDSAFWNSRNMSIDTAKLEGTIKTKDDKTIPLELEFVKEDGQWKILSIDVKGGIAQDKIIPTDSDVIKLVNGSIQLFGEAVKNEDFSVFHSLVAKIWQAQTTPEDLKASFITFIDNKVDLTVLSNTTPFLSEKPIIDSDGLLILKGYYSYQNYPPVNFQLKYIYEYPEWKLVGIKIDLE